MVADILNTAVGICLTITKLNYTPWIWLTLLIVGLAITPFVAFHKIRMERDKLLDRAKPKLKVEGAGLSENRGVSGGTWWLKVANQGTNDAQGTGILEQIELAYPGKSQSMASYSQGRPLIWGGANPIPGGSPSVLDVIYRDPSTLSSYHYGLAYSDYNGRNPSLPTGMDLLLVISVVAKDTIPLYTVCYFLGKDSVMLDRFEILDSNLLERPTIEQCRQMLESYKGVLAKQ
ncbi:MAG: hypothetical protein MUO97_11190 [Dehalococcoidia bacterium]|nr:hypothetical protein [Dehalococcoidia bacterium]